MMGLSFTKDNIYGGFLMSEALPPKTCTIDRLITKQEDIEKVLNGSKTATRRNGRYADPGEIMELEGRRFVVNNVFSQRLGELTDEHCQAEGFQSLEEYKNYIISMHPGMPWLPHMTVWVHEFKPAAE
jgi:N4-acetylcytidine amidohydrolase